MEITISQTTADALMRAKAAHTIKPIYDVIEALTEAAIEQSTRDWLIAFIPRVDAARDVLLRDGITPAAMKLMDDLPAVLVSKKNEFARGLRAMGFDEIRRG